MTTQIVDIKIENSQDLLFEQPVRTLDSFFCRQHNVECRS